MNGDAVFLSQAHRIDISSLLDRDSIVHEVQLDPVRVGIAIVYGFLIS